MREPGNQDILRDWNRAVQAWTEASAELCVLNNRAWNEFSLNLSEAILPIDNPGIRSAPEREKQTASDPGEEFGKSLYDIGSACMRAANLGSEMLRLTLTRFFDRYSE